MTAPFTDIAVAKAKDAAVHATNEMTDAASIARLAVETATAVLGEDVQAKIAAADAAAATAIGAARRAIEKDDRPDQLALVRQWFASRATPGRYDDQLLRELGGILATDIDDRIIHVADADDPIEHRYDALLDKFVLESEFSTGAHAALRRVAEAPTVEDARDIARTALGG